jgi:hypothetical protein
MSPVHCLISLSATIERYDLEGLFIGSLRGGHSSIINFCLYFNVVYFLFLNIYYIHFLTICQEEFWFIYYLVVKTLTQSQRGCIHLESVRLIRIALQVALISISLLFF